MAGTSPKSATPAPSGPVDASGLELPQGELTHGFHTLSHCYELSCLLVKSEPNPDVSVLYTAGACMRLSRGNRNGKWAWALC